MDEERKLKIAALRWRCFDDAVMEGPPSCSMKDLKKPRLRKCAFDLNTISWISCLGGGRDGYCWKVAFGDEGPFVLKLFWDKARPQFGHLAVELECRNAALLQMMETAVEDGKAAGTPVMVYSKPEEWVDAIDNIHSFSTEDRQNPNAIVEWAAKLNKEIQPVLSVPRLRKCYGWLSVSGESLKALPKHLRPPPVRVDRKLTRRLAYDSTGPEYVAIVYEYVEPGANDAAALQEVINFLYLAGFAFATTPLTRNWENNVLLDLSDIINPYQLYWRKRRYSQGIQAETILKNH